MSDPSGPQHANRAERESMDATGQVLWQAMAAIVDSNPHYAGVTPEGRCACILRLALQAIGGIANTEAPDGAGARVILSAAGRMAGQVIVQAPPELQAAALDYLLGEVDIGAADLAAVMVPRGSA